MNTNDLISEIIYYFKYFNMIEIENYNDKIIISMEIYDRWGNVIFLKNLVERFQIQMRKNRSMNEQSKKRLNVLLLELENRKLTLKR